jgi:hypothetical protein
LGICNAFPLQWTFQSIMNVCFELLRNQVPGNQTRTYSIPKQSLPHRNQIDMGAVVSHPAPPNLVESPCERAAERCRRVNMLPDTCLLPSLPTYLSLSLTLILRSVGSWADLGVAVLCK